MEGVGQHSNLKKCDLYESPINGCECNTIQKGNGESGMDDGAKGWGGCAGRMQDNEPLMRALSNLICTNTPELVLFVGEALVGNDAVDQLTKFNQRLLDLSTSRKPHAIDGILLTKFDTIDDKVNRHPPSCSILPTLQSLRIERERGSAQRPPSFIVPISSSLAWLMHERCHMIPYSPPPFASNVSSCACL